MHNNKIKDSEPHFIIDPFTRTISNTSTDNNIIVQYDHNSERFTFEMPRYVDGHDMSECKESGEVRVNFRNSASTGLSKNDGIYICDDLAVSTEDEDKVTFSWLLSSVATQYIGYLYFSIQFICYDGEKLVYSWNTGIYKDIVIVESINNVEELVASDSFKELTDLVEDAKEIIEVAGPVIENATVATEQARASVCYIQKTADGKIQILDADRKVIDTVDTFCGDDDTLHRYIDGMLSVVGIKERNNDNTLRMWVGTNEEYSALEFKDPATFYWITDDASYGLVEAAINALNESFTELETALISGEFVVAKADRANGAGNADHAGEADQAGYASHAGHADSADYAYNLRDPGWTQVHDTYCEITENGLYCFYITGTLNCSVCFYVDTRKTAHSALCETASGQHAWICNAGTDIYVECGGGSEVEIQDYCRIF